MAYSALLGSRRKARLVYTLRGMLWASMLWPLMFGCVFWVATAWTERPQWQPAAVREGSHYRSHWYR